MAGDAHGIDNEEEVAVQAGDQEEVAEEAGAAVAVDGTDYQVLLVKQEACIKELESQVAEAAKTTEVADSLRGELKKVKARAADERAEYGLCLAGVRNVKAAKALLDDHGGDVAALKEAEP